jgi:hypothetical protein
MKYCGFLASRNIAALTLGFALGASLFAEAPAGSAGKAPAIPADRPRFGWKLLGTGSWEEGRHLNNRGDLRLSFPVPGLVIRAEIIDKRPLNPRASPPLNGFSQGLTNYGAGLYHKPTGSRLLYGILDEGGLSARLRNPWGRALPFAENHQPLMADLKTAVSSTGEPETYLYLGSPGLIIFPSGAGGGIKLRGFALAQIDRKIQPGFGGGIEALFGQRIEIRLDGFSTQKTLPPRSSSAWFSLSPPLPEREFRLHGLGLLLNAPPVTFSSDWALSETFAGSRDIYGNLGFRFARPLSAGRGRWTLSLAADGAGSRFTGRDGSGPGAGFRGGGKFEWQGRRSSLLRFQTSLRAPGFGEAFNRSASSLSWRLPAPGKTGGGPFRLTRLSLGADRNASDSEKILDSLSLGLGFSLNPRLWGKAASASAGGSGFFKAPLGLSFSGSLKGLAAAEGRRPAPYPLPQYPYVFDSAGAAGELSWSPGIFQFRTKLGYEAKKAEGVFEMSVSAAARFGPGRFSFKLSSPDFPGEWNYTLAWRMEKK